MTAAMFDASCSAITSSSLSASSLAAVLGHALLERACGRLGVGNVVRLNALAEQLAVAHDATHRDAAVVHAVVTLFAADQARLGALALGAPVGAGHLERRIGRLGTRAGEEHVVQPGGREVLDPVGQLERQPGGRTGKRARSRASSPRPGPWPRRSRGGHGPDPNTTGPKGRRRSCGLRRRCSRRRWRSTTMRGFALKLRLPVKGIQ
jgi:hypothetical protein